MGCQVKQCKRVISPRQYDEAAEQTPHLCPLIMAGDLRSGQTLLDNARTDFNSTIESLSQNKKGRQRLDQVTNYINRILLKLESPGKSGKPVPQNSISTKLKVTALKRKRESDNVERPFAFSKLSISFDKESPVMDFMLRHGWAYMPARRTWSFGFRPERIIRMLNALPPLICNSLARLLNTIQGESHRVMKEISSVLTAIRETDATSDLPVGVEHRTGLHCTDHHSSYLHPESESDEERILWEEEEEIGLMRLDLDPDTQIRRKVTINSRFASMHGCHREELLSQIANHEAVMQYTDLDALSSFIFEMAGSLESTNVVYIRMCSGTGKNLKRMLVCRKRYKVFNAVGQLTQVCGNVISFSKHLPEALHESRTVI